MTGSKRSDPVIFNFIKSLMIHELDELHLELAKRKPCAFSLQVETNQVSPSP